MGKPFVAVGVLVGADSRLRSVWSVARIANWSLVFELNVVGLSRSVVEVYASRIATQAAKRAG